MSERYIVDLPISSVSADVAGAPASMIEHYVRCVGRPESSSLTSFAVSPLSDGDGWQLVPREPTAAMVEATADMDVYWNYDADGRPGGPEDVYRAMLAAALPREEVAHE